jgi:hypothetical protein
VCKFCEEGWFMSSPLRWKMSGVEAEARRRRGGTRSGRIISDPSFFESLENAYQLF